MSASTAFLSVFHRAPRPSFDGVAQTQSRVNSAPASPSYERVRSASFRFPSRRAPQLRRRRANPIAYHPGPSRRPMSAPTALLSVFHRAARLSLDGVAQTQSRIIPRPSRRPMSASTALLSVFPCVPRPVSTVSRKPSRASTPRPNRRPMSASTALLSVFHRAARPSFDGVVQAQSRIIPRPSRRPMSASTALLPFSLASRAPASTASRKPSRASSRARVAVL